jgi:hypothetical protein
VWSGVGDRGTELRRQFFSGAGVRCGHTEPVGDGHEVNVRIGQIEKGPSYRASRGCPDPHQLDLQNRVRMVVEDDDGDIQLFAGHRPQRRNRVQRASIGLQRNHRSMRGGDRGADRHR